MNAKLVKHLMFPLHEWAKGKRTLVSLKELERTQWLDNDVLFEYRLRRLRVFLQHAYDSVPYYHRLFNECGFVPQVLRDFDDLKKIPFLTKEIIRQNLENLRSKSYRGKMQLASTGGSTGEPVAVYWDMNRLSWDTAAQLRCQGWFGIDVGEKEAVFWASPIEITKQDRMRTLRDRFINSMLFSAFNVSERTVDSYVSVLQSWNPSKVYGYASVIYAVADYLLRKNIVSVNGLKAIFPTAEPLYDFQRQTIQKAFGCSVSVEYGSRDVGAIAHECPQGGLHLNAENIILEILPAEKNLLGETSGEIIVTNMSTMGMPLIRYRIGDIGTIANGSCSCGRSLPLLGNVEGRSTDFLVGHDGRLIHALSVIYILRDIKKIKQFRVIQESVHTVIVEIVLSSALTEREVASIKEKIKKILNDVEVVINLVNHIDPLPSGKHRYVISRVVPDRVKAKEEIDANRLPS